MKDRRAYFDARVKEDPETGCWLWIGSTNGTYGCANIDYKQVSAHRLAWELFRGPIPEGQNVLHRCDRPLCVNPSHLFLGTQEDNLKDMTQKGRRAKGEAVASFAGRKHSESTKSKQSEARRNWWAQRRA